MKIVLPTPYPTFSAYTKQYGKNLFFAVVAWLIARLTLGTYNWAMKRLRKTM